MNSILGSAFVLLALFCAGFGSSVGVWAGVQRKELGGAWVARSVWGFFLAMLLANLTMVYALVSHDFSVKYVAQVGSRSTPLLYTVVSLWSALEGSILFWGLILGSYLLAFYLSCRKQHARYLSLALGVMLGVAAFFALLIAAPANPFLSVSPVLPDGPGPNPLLQNHVLMVIHPPMLYLGYVGMTVPFGLTAAALIRGELAPAWMAPLRRWTLIPWGFLTVGITLGAWWAYAVLGWGGYWAWDPVENASFLPWLTATAFLHSVMVLERKRLLTLWTVLLGLASFALTLLGTFMTRSGIFNSVHSFTQSEIGPSFLVFLGVVLLGSLLLLAFRGHLLLREPGQFQDVASREVSMLLNNLLFSGITFVVLIGTTWPLIAEALLNKRMSVGEPYFNRMFVPGALGILFLMGVGPVLPWGVSDRRTVLRQLLLPSLAGVGVAGLCAAVGLRGFAPLLTFALAAFAGVVTLRELFLPARIRMAQRQEAPWVALFRSAARARRRFGGYLVHLGIIVIAVAVAASSSYSAHTSATLRAGQSLSLSGYQLTFLGLSKGREPHRDFVAAKLAVTNAKGYSEEIAPRMNYYARSNDPVQTPWVSSRLHEDLYVSLMAYSEGSASFNVWTFPLVGWIWWSLPFLILGTLIAAWPQKQRSLVALGSAPQEAVPSDASPAQAEVA